MSAEGKKKRGEAGVSNARNIPFRCHGFPRGYTLSTSIGRSDHPRGAGGKLLAAMTLARVLPGFNPSDRLMRMTDAAINHIEDHHSNTLTAREWRAAA